MKETLGTFAVSAFWHGFYPFYYAMFFISGCFVELAKDIYRSRALFYFLSPSVSHWLANFLTMTVMNFLGTSFSLLTFEKGGNFGNATYYFIFICIPILMVGIKVLGLPAKAKAFE